MVGTVEHPLRLLSVGRLDWRKGYSTARCKPYRCCAHKGIFCEYRIIGEGDFLGPLAFARHQFGLEDVVHLQGAQTREQVKQEMLWADVFLHAAVSEGFCNAVVEAQAMSLPVKVCSDAGELPENVAHGETGFVVPRRNAPLITQRI
ncbi:MAG: glycosyltransferase family 4 protein [Pyrinomonadaceae bacterium]